MTTAAAEPPIIPALLTLDLIRLHYLPLAKRTIHRLISAGLFPQADIQHGRKIRLWGRETVEEWVEKNHK